jgi:hypothetical protein
MLVGLIEMKFIVYMLRVLRSRMLREIMEGVVMKAGNVTGLK